ncbi:VPLPA-CTERM sorting domain-containing protein [Primorskyibacter sp. 2E107]|uniref:VPLPA-CTERM sorting domain-containing protein n=1 Tax=Primorskyibacter sp. 2E107 TaxID=3403458 RepID=UPI003AF66F85
MKKSFVCAAITAIAFVGLPAASFAATFHSPGYTNVSVGTVPDTANGFGNMAFGSDGTGYIVGGYGTNQGDIYSLDNGGSFALLASNGSIGLGIAVHGGFAYTTDENKNIVKTDIATGAQTTLMNLGGDSPNGLEIIAGLDGASFTLAVAQYNGTVTFVNGDTGAVQYTVATGATGLSNIEQGLDGSLYATNHGQQSVVRLDHTGVLSTVSFGIAYDGIAVHKGTGALYGFGPGVTGIDLLDISTGVATDFVSGLAGDGGYYPGLLEFSNDGTRLYYGERDNGLAISYIDGFDAITTAAVPLPAGATLMLIALGGLGAARRRRES